VCVIENSAIKWKEKKQKEEEEEEDEKRTSSDRTVSNGREGSDKARENDGFCLR
jgi:hypothetical protein